MASSIATTRVGEASSAVTMGASCREVVLAASLQVAALTIAIGIDSVETPVRIAGSTRPC